MPNPLFFFVHLIEWIVKLKTQYGVPQKKKKKLKLSFGLHTNTVPSMNIVQVWNANSISFLFVDTAF